MKPTKLLTHLSLLAWLALPVAGFAQAGAGNAGAAGRQQPGEDTLTRDTERVNTRAEVSEQDKHSLDDLANAVKKATAQAKSEAQRAAQQKGSAWNAATNNAGASAAASGAAASAASAVAERAADD